jgi:hypothetical protein
MKDTPWDHGLRITAEADGLAGHAGAVLLCKLADQVGLTGALGSALTRTGKFPMVDRGITLVSMAVAIALGATGMSDIALLAHQEPVFGAAPSDTTVRRTLELDAVGPAGQLLYVTGSGSRHAVTVAQQGSLVPRPVPWRGEAEPSFRRCAARDSNPEPAD